MAGERPYLVWNGAKHRTRKLSNKHITYFSDASVMIRHVEYPNFYSPLHRFHHFYDINTSDSLTNRSYFGPLLGLSALASIKQSGRVIQWTRLGRATGGVLVAHYYDSSSSDWLALRTAAFGPITALLTAQVPMAALTRQRGVNGGLFETPQNRRCFIAPPMVFHEIFIPVCFFASLLSNFGRKTVFIEDFFVEFCDF